MIHQWSEPWSAIGPSTMASALPEGGVGIFERGGKAAVAAEVAVDTVRDLHAKIGTLAVANDFLARKPKPWIGKRGAA